MSLTALRVDCSGPFVAEDILQQQKADLIAIAREALANPSWPQMAEIALGRKPADAMDDWPVQYGWWLKHRERTFEQIRADETAAGKPEHVRRPGIESPDSSLER
jgi:hypothetical protein